MSWETKKFSALVADTKHSIVGGPFGSKLTSKDYVEEGVPVIRGANMSNGRYISETGFVFVSDEKKQKDLNSNLAKPGDMVFTQRGTLGQVALIPEDASYKEYVVSQSQMKATLDPAKADKQFYYYYFSSDKGGQHHFEHDFFFGGSKDINLGTLKDFEIPVPDLPTQERIASILSAYDDLIENNRRRIALLEQAARLLYREWFVHFRFPGHETAKFVDGLPEGWNMRALSDLANIVMGQSPKSEFYNNVGDGLPFHQGVTNYGFRFVEDKTFSTAITKLANAGDILFSVRAPVGRINYTLNNMVLGRGLSAFRSLDDHQSFLFYCLKSHFFKEDLIGGGAIYAATNKKELETLEVVCPSEDLIASFDEKASSIDAQIRVLSLKNRQLTKARDLLLPRLMDGRVPVKV